MLIMISNRCDEGCPHCLQDAREDGGLMSLDTFRQAVDFAETMGCRLILITGGEPTENPLMERMLQHIERQCHRTGLRFAIATNGTWIENDEKRRMMWRISRMKAYTGIQVYTHRRWYADYDFIQDWRTELEQIPGCTVDDSSPIFMQDLGRARTSRDAQAEVTKNPYRCSCLNAALAARQVALPMLLIPTLEQQGKFCKPMIDIDGNLHMSESRLCPVVGNVVTDTLADIWSRMQRFTPCMACRNSRRLYDPDPMLAAARRILGIPPQESLAEIKREAVNP